MISRRELLRLMAATGAFAPLGAAGWRRAHADDDEDGGEADETVGKAYLIRGLAALARAHEFRWNVGHHGCAVIAGYYLGRENDLAPGALRGIADHLDRFIRHRAKFMPDEPIRGDGGASVEPILEALAETVGSLRSGGHDAIYGSLALRALQDAPEAATPEVIDGVRRLLRRFEREVSVEEPSEHHRSYPMTPYREVDDIVAATLDAVLRPWSHFVKGTPTSAGNVVHWVTHADALVTLRELGHVELAEKAGAAHQQYINHPIESAEPGDPPAPPALTDWRAPAYWVSDDPRVIQKGSWFFGHSFKLPYSLLRLLGRVDDPERRAEVLERAILLPELFR